MVTCSSPKQNPGFSIPREAKSAFDFDENAESGRLAKLRVSLSVRTCELFLLFCFSLFYVTGEFPRFLHRGRAQITEYKVERFAKPVPLFVFNLVLAGDIFIVLLRI